MIDGFIVIDKPAGITSHDVVSRVRRLLGTRKVGHTGTLDPFATGVLPVAVNDGTKAIPFLDEGSKCYEAVLRFGVVTDTLDLTGTVLHETDASAVSAEQVSACLAAFRGRISQIPPMYSAIKLGGQPLYKLARKGEEVERHPREVEIHSLELTGFCSPCASLRVTCSRGTYVRTLADDIGRKLGCGAALRELRRTASGPFRIEAAVTLEELEDAVRSGRVAGCAITIPAALGHLPELALDDTELVQVGHGRVPEALLGRLPAEHRTEGVLVRLAYGGRLAAVASVAPMGSMILKRVFVQN